MTFVKFTSDHPALDLGKLISLWTLALAPLIAHVIAGAPEPIYLCAEPPRWIDYAVFWNPTSIIWHYFAIFDRRIRAKDWNREILASSNALYWTTNGWNGSEDMIKEGRNHYIRLPLRSHAELLSKSFVNTVIATLQGVQALYGLLLVDNFNNDMSLTTVSLPLALLGLMGLPSALWITDGFAYNHYDINLSNKRASQVTTTTKAGYHELITVPSSGDDTPQWPPPTSDDTSYAEFRSWTSIHGCVARIIFLTPLLGMAGLTFFWIYLTLKNSDWITGTGLSSLMLWFTFSVESTFVFILNIARAQDRTTVVPGVSTLWYRLYSAILFLLMLALLITASIETKETWCGKFTVLYDESVCPWIAYLPQDTYMYFNATATDGSSSRTGFINATKAYLAGLYSVRVVNASLDATPETAYAFLNQSLEEYIRNIDS
ncbi:hypothetical protein AA0114_g10189 [Alternaria tenuissima]|jgi:hypothetical protein|uniref:Uncharacterized protein n=1 Tax=Alternaria tenuissima TaxID=119927 RepID=A0A4Q4M4K9_9PLEO|nr:hypothetical protein AA0114_g10189 [Alternaria tenuissima]